MTRPRLRTILVVGTVLLTLYGGLCGYYYRGLCQEPEEIAQLLDRTPMPVFMVLPFMSMWNAARAGTLESGTTAPDFTLERHAGNGTVTLSDHRGEKPVVLVFGSYT